MYQKINFKFENIDNFNLQQIVIKLDKYHKNL